jgi:hypothetical protein
MVKLEFWQLIHLYLGNAIPMPEIFTCYLQFNLGLNRFPHKVLCIWHSSFSGSSVYLLVGKSLFTARQSFSNLAYAIGNGNAAQIYFIKL